MIYVWAAYGAAFIILGGVTLGSVLRHVRLKREERRHEP